MILPNQLEAVMNADRVDPEDPLTDLKYTPITAQEQKLLENLVKSYSEYVYNIGLYPGLSTKIDAEQSEPTDITYMLKAILVALDELPPVSVDSQGTDKAPSFFSTTSNWGILAQDVLNQFYDPASSGTSTWRRSYMTVQRPVQDITLNDNVLLPRNKTGRKY